MSLAKAALTLALPLILAHCASPAPSDKPLTYDAKSVGKPNSGASSPTRSSHDGTSAMMATLRKQRTD